MVEKIHSELVEGKKKIKVLRIINRFNLGGPTFNAAYLTKYLEGDFETLLFQHLFSLTYSLGEVLIF